MKKVNVKKENAFFQPHQQSTSSERPTKTYVAIRSSGAGGVSTTSSQLGEVPLGVPAAAAVDVEETSLLLLTAAVVVTCPFVVAACCVTIDIIDDALDATAFDDDDEAHASGLPASCPGPASPSSLRFLTPCRGVSRQEKNTT